MIEITPAIKMGNVGEFGDMAVITAAGIELAVLAQLGRGFPHSSPTLGCLSLQVAGVSPDWYIRGIVDLLVRAYNANKVIGLFDDTGGAGEARFLLACTHAEKHGESFAQGRTWANTQAGDTDQIEATLSIRGAALWP